MQLKAGVVVNEYSLQIVCVTNRARFNNWKGNHMARTVFCVKLGRELEGLDEPPQPGELGQRIYENVSKEAWKMWLNQQIMLINEYRLNLTDPKANEFLDQQMEQFFFGEGADLPPDYVPPTQQSK